MNFGLIWVMAVLSFVYFCEIYAIDDKLDFGGHPSSRHSSFVNDQATHRTSFFPAKHSTITTVGNSEDFDKIGIVCTDGGCNTTKSQISSDDSIKTDVVVHIEAKVDLKSNRSQVVDDVPDIPVVIGTDDSNPNRNEYNGFNTQMKSMFIPQEQPNYSTGLYINPNPSHVSSNAYPNRQIDSEDFGIDSGLNINIKSMPAVPVQIPNLDRNMLTTNYNSNGVELNVPFFDPTLHNHYYGEAPPPQSAFYPRRRTSIMNPVEFKLMKSNWRPSTWQGHYHSYNIMPIPMSRTPQCYCQNGQTGRDLSWYPNSSDNRRNNGLYSNTKTSINDPGSQINDKLASLN